jgi:hypothetical protein
MKKRALMKQWILTVATVIAMAGSVAAQGGKPASPVGTAATQVGPKYSKWIEISYSRPILRGRAGIFGSGANYGKAILAGAPVWRAGANISTRLSTEVPLVIGGKTIPQGEYSVFIDIKGERDWTLVLSSYGALTNPRQPKPGHLWGAYDYKPDKDVVRVPMTVSTSAAQTDQLTWGFADVTEEGGNLQISWAKTVAAVAFKTGT